MVTSGIRIGTAALTTRGMREAEFEQVGHLIADVIEDPEGEATRKAVSSKAGEICERFPLFAWADGVPE